MVAQVYPIAAILAARIAGDDPAMDAAAADLESKVRSYAVAHSVTGDYLAGIGTERIAGKRGVTDRIVYVDDPAAAHIEFGHHSRGDTYVDGLHIFGKAAR